MQSTLNRSSRCVAQQRALTRVNYVARSAVRSVRVMAEHAPATVSDTKAKFYNSFRRPIPNIYNVVLQELLVQMHFVRYSINYSYNPVYALGFVSVFDQILESMSESDRTAIFKAYVEALGESPEQYRKDAAALEAAAASLNTDSLSPDAAGGEVQKALAAIAEQTAAGKFQYNKFFAIGLFRLLELTGAKEPSALEKLVKAVGAKPEAVNKDLMLYKGILSKLSTAKELMKEFLERERRKQAEREAEKKAKAEKAASENSGTAVQA